MVILNSSARISLLCAVITHCMKNPSSATETCPWCEAELSAPCCRWAWLGGRMGLRCTVAALSSCRVRILQVLLHNASSSKQQCKRRAWKSGVVVFPPNMSSFTSQKERYLADKLVCISNIAESRHAGSPILVFQLGLSFGWS